MKQIKLTSVIAKTEPAKIVGMANHSGLEDDRIFFRIVSCSTALAFGVMLAIFEALYNDGSGFSFHLSVGTLAAFVLGFAGGLIYWKIVLLASSGRTSLLLRISSFLLLLAGVVTFLSPLRFVPVEKLSEVFKGLAAAMVVVSWIGFMIWRLKIFFDQDAATVEVGLNAQK